MDANASDDRGKSSVWEDKQSSIADQQFKRAPVKAQPIVQEATTVLMWEVKIIQEYCSQGSLRKVC